MSEKQAISGHPRGKLPIAPEGDGLCIWPAGYELNVSVGVMVTAGQIIIARKADAA